MSEVRRLGGFWEISDLGHIINPGQVEYIKEPWLSLVGAIRQVCLSNCGDQLHSLYIRGSVVRGLAVPGVSDVDGLAILKPDAKIQDFSWLRAAREELLQTFDCASDIALDFFAYDFILAPSLVRFAIKTQSVCIYGPDLAPEIPPYKPNIESVFNLFDINGVRGIFDRHYTTDALTWQERSIMKLIVRAGFDLVMERERRFTRDLYPCYEMFAKYYPARRAEMYQALEWAVSPTTDQSALCALTQNIGEWLCEEADKYYPRAARTNLVGSYRFKLNKLKR